MLNNISICLLHATEDRLEEELEWDLGPLFTTSCFHFLTASFAFCDTSLSANVRNLPTTLPISENYNEINKVSLHMNSIPFIIPLIVLLLLLYVLIVRAHLKAPSYIFKKEFSVSKLSAYQIITQVHTFVFSVSGADAFTIQVFALDIVSLSSEFI